MLLVAGGREDGAGVLKLDVAKGAKEWKPAASMHQKRRNFALGIIRRKVL